ncbi:hypothetical protein CC2G_012739 [Coprinopsis cinerea AmutBmut pab1-1]|nr:hypothetical protein CC2G_012739 [Coprinopsis cinerea AmutBmut pab1-1]
MAETLLAFKAGRAFRREGTKFVDADATKGAIILSNGEDGLLHFIWKNRITNEVADDLILFPGDATFSKVTESNGRVWVLKFESSGSRHFFWMQVILSECNESLQSLMSPLSEGCRLFPRPRIR